MKFSDICRGLFILTTLYFQLQEFRLKAGGILPRIPKNNPPQGRTEFSGINDLLQYLIDEDNRKKVEETKLKLNAPMTDPD